MPVPSDADSRLLNALASLNEIGAAINRIGLADERESVGADPARHRPGATGMRSTLQLIADSAIKVLPGASAVIFVYDQAHGAFDATSRVSAGEPVPTDPSDEPRPDGMGHRAIGQRRRVLSYDEQDLDVHPIKVDAGARAVACYPLIVADQLLGVLYVYLREARKFGQLELLMLENFVNQAGLTIYQVRRLADIRRDLARKEDELVRLRRAGLLISSRLELEETLETILQMALEVTGAQFGIFRLVGGGGQHLVTHAVAGDQLARPQVEALPLDASSIMGWVAKNRQPIAIPDLREVPRNLVYYPLDADLEMRSEVAVPLIGAGNRLEGVLNLESPVVGALGEEDRLLLQSLATQAVIAIQEIRLLDALKEMAELLLTRSLEGVLVRLAELAHDLLNTTACRLYLLQAGELREAAVSGHEAGGCAAPDMRSAAVRAIARMRSDVHSSEAATTGDHETGWILTVPLRTRDDDRAVGVLVVYSEADAQGGYAPSEWDEKVLKVLADYATLAVHNSARLEALRVAQEQHAVAETFAAVGDLAANLLHKLNNKVGTIPVRVQGIQDKCQPYVAADQYLAANLIEIERSATEAMESVRDNLSHLHPIRLGPVEVATCVGDAIRTTNLPDGICVQTRELDQLPAVVAGQRSLTLVFVNLLENAANAMQGAGLVTIGGSNQGEWVQVAVRDDGPGISPMLHDKVFEFSHSNGGDRDKDSQGKKGAINLGFGLWWVKTMMVRLGGSVSIESDGLSGTTFWLNLPRAGEGS